MADLLVRHLQEKGKEHSALALLVNQWGFDEQLIPKALQTIGSLFPHYSRHDESHSRQILVNIERLLGENIKLLTATDTWLLLEAAYWHDIGMVVPQSDLESAFVDEDFKQYVESIRNSPNHELHQFCQSFSTDNVAGCFNGAATPIQAVDKLRQLMAEWFRRQHAKRADSIIQSPWINAGIHSPRTELIPARLFKILGRICMMHGSSFSELLGKDGLPFREAGLAQEDCHPRFVACLLRMGDLLDLDDNRFCPVMQRIAGDSRPKLTKAHEDKHSAVRHLRIDREYIEIDSECESIDGYVEAFKWFDWLKQEMQDQMSNWQRIVPSRELGLLPTLGKISVRLSGKLQILSEGVRPQFTIDTERAKELLQGSNLYSNRFACIRELLQNSVDATLLRLWLTKGKERPESGWENPLSDVARALLQDASIKVDLHEKNGPSEDGKSIWVLSITDEGTGISKQDLLYMLKIGGSQGNVERQKRINTMPEWMKPSGVFGIGFQSVFLISEKVEIVTKSIFSSEVLQIIMHSPTSDKEGLVLVQQLQGDIFHPYGTKITLELSLSKDYRPYARREKEHTIAQRVAWAFDPVLDQPIAISAANLADKIFEFARYTPIAITGSMKTADGKHFVAIENQGLEDREALGGWRFVKVNGCQLRMRYRPTLEDEPARESLQFYYRGQQFVAHVDIPFVKLEIDLLSGKAGGWLNASRDSIAGKAYETFQQLVLSALELLVEDDIENMRKCEWLSPEEIPVFSFFLNRMSLAFGGVWDSFAVRLGDKWANLPSGDGENALRYYLGKSEMILGVGTYLSVSNHKKFDLILNNSVGELFLREWEKNPSKSICVMDFSEVDGREDMYAKCYSLKSMPQKPYTWQGLAHHLLRQSQATFANTRHIVRLYDEKWSKLCLRDDVEIYATEILEVNKEDSRRVLLPFLFRATSSKYHLASVEVASLDELCAWVKPKLIISSELSEIRLIYQDLIEYIDKEVMGKSPYSKRWMERRGLVPKRKLSR